MAKDAALGGLSAFTPIGLIGVYKTAENIDKLTNKCQGGFLYYNIICEVTLPAKGGGKCTDPKQGKDPKAEEYKAFLADLAEASKVNAGIKQPCGEGKFNSMTNPGQCKELNTAIGKIRVDSPQGFIKAIFEFVLVIASFGGLIIMIYAGYVFMTSRGDKEKIAGARETLTAAIVGLLFIVLAIVILEIIGVEILQIPGLKR